jgi:hypothetical protein
MFRQSQLEKQGFVFYRIWSTNWWDSPEKELKKLVDFISDFDKAENNSSNKPLYNFFAGEKVRIGSKSITHEVAKAIGDGGLSVGKSREEEKIFDLKFKKSCENCDAEDIEYFVDFVKGRILSEIESSGTLNLRKLLDKAMEELGSDTRFTENVHLKKINKNEFCSGLKNMFSRMIDNLESQNSDGDSPEVLN